MPIYQGRRKGTFRVTVWKDGEQHEEIFEGSRRQATEHEARMRIELGAKSTRLKQRIAPSFSVFCVEGFEPRARARLGARTWRKTVCYIVATLRGFFGTYRLDALTPPLVDAYIAERSKTLIASTLNRELGVLRTIIKAAREAGLPVSDVKIPHLRETRGRVRAWSSEDFAKLVATARAKWPRFVPVLLFLVNTGCRKGEALAARWSWIDGKRRMLTVTPSETWAPKNKSPREIPISDALAALLERLPKHTPWIFPNANGGRFVQFPNEHFAAMVKAAGLVGGAHTCRHTFASLFLAHGGSLWQLSTLLGHSLSRTTEIYAHMLPEHLEQARNVVNISGNPGGKPWRRRASA